MPVEIMELVVKASVREKGNQGPASDNSGELRSFSSEEKSILIQEVVEQILEILRQQTER